MSGKLLMLVGVLLLAACANENGQSVSLRGVIPMDAELIVQ